jgi:hypothetical protein
MDSYAAEWHAATNAEIAEAIANTFSALASWGQDTETQAYHAAMWAEADSRGGLREEAQAILDYRESLEK